MKRFPRTLNRSESLTLVALLRGPVAAPTFRLYWARLRHLGLVTWDGAHLTLTSAGRAYLEAHGPKSRLIAGRVSEAQGVEVDRAAAERGLSTSEVVQESVAAWLKHLKDIVG